MHVRLGLGERFPEFSLHACASAEPRVGIPASSIRASWRERGCVLIWPRDFTFVVSNQPVEESNRALREFRALAARCSV